jgi:putative membrane protein
MMIDDHTQLATDLEKLQAANFVTSEDSISTTHQQMLTDLEKKHAVAFDKAYMQEIISEHEEQLTLFNAASREKDPDISDFAQKRLPALKAHLDSAKAISLTLK